MSEPAASKDVEPEDSSPEDGVDVTEQVGTDQSTTRAGQDESELDEAAGRANTTSATGFSVTTRRT